MCALHFFILFYSWAMRRVYLLFASRALCHILFFFLGSTLNSGPHARTKHSTQSGSFVHFLLLFSFFLNFANLPFTVERYGCLCVASFKLLMKKSDSPTSCIFAVVTVYPNGECMFEKAWANPRRESYTSGSPTPSVAQSLRFRSFSIKPVESTRSSSIGFSFSAFFCGFVETEMTQERDQKRH